MARPGRKVPPPVLGTFRPELRFQTFAGSSTYQVWRAGGRVRGTRPAGLRGKDSQSPKRTARCRRWTQPTYFQAEPGAVGAAN